MFNVASRWKADVDRGPDWVFVRLRPGQHPGDSPLADYLWSILQQHFTYRLVLELDEVRDLQSHLIGQLALLAQRIQKRGGLLRLCGLSEDNKALLNTCRLDSYMPHFATRGEAVMGHRPHQPR